MDTQSSIVLGAIGLQTLGLVFALVKFSFGRNVKAEDDAREDLKKRVDAHEKDIASMQGDLKTLVSTLPELKGMLGEMSRSFEQTRDKQAAFYRGELEKMEQLLRQDMTRAVSPDTGMRLTALEARITALEAPQSPRRPKRG